MNNIDIIDESEIFPIWKEMLWPDRKSPVESHSAMIYCSEQYDGGNFLLPVGYFGYRLNNIIVGVNSCHLCTDGSARSRGLWVHPDYRKNGIGSNLLRVAIDMAREHSARFIWSFPRKSSWNTYESVGFSLSSSWSQSETSSANAYCYLGL